MKITILLLLASILVVLPLQAATHDEVSKQIDENICFTKRMHCSDSKFAIVKFYVNKDGMPESLRWDNNGASSSMITGCTKAIYASVPFKISNQEFVYSCGLKCPAKELKKYMSEIEKIIKSKWRPNSHLPKFKKPYSAQVKFSIDKQGNIKNISIAQSSHNADYDALSLRTIQISSPLPPPPIDAAEPDQEQKVHFNFDYNLSQANVNGFQVGAFCLSFLRILL